MTERYVGHNARSYLIPHSLIPFTFALLNAYNMKWIFLLGSLTFISACAPDTRLLEGAWRLTGYYQDGQAIQVPLDSVGLVLHPNRIYEFRSIGLYREKGAFRTSASYLFLRDSTRRDAEERALKILLLTEDSLKLKMQRAEKEQVLFFSKIE